MEFKSYSTIRAASLSLTLVMVASCLFFWGLAIARMTEGLSVWTFEEQRLSAIARGELKTSPITMLDAAGHRQTLFGSPTTSNVQRQIFIVDFIYTRCPSICQSMGSEYFRMQSQLMLFAWEAASPENRIRLLSITLDPKNDGPLELTAYGQLHHADAGYWTLATPQNVSAGQALLHDLRVIVIPDGFGGFVHNAGIHLIDGQGHLRAIYPYDQWEAALVAARGYVRESP